MKLPCFCAYLAVALLGAPIAAKGDVETLDHQPAPHTLPSVEQVLEGLRRRMDAAEQEKAQFQEKYRHVRQRTREERSPKGKIRKRTEERLVHDPSAANSATEAEGAQAGQGRAYQEQDVPLDSQILERFEFEVEARESWEGREVLRVQFQPRPGDLPKHSLLDRFINHTAGTLWLAEPSMAVARARMALQEPVELWGGIIGAVYRLEMAYDRASTPDGLWYTRQGTWRVDYRKFLVRSVVDFEELSLEVEPIADRKP